MSDTTTTALFERYRRITFYPAANNDAGWIGAVLARFCPARGRVLDPFCGSASMSLVAAIEGYEGLASDSNPLTEVFIQMFRGNERFFAELQIDLVALGDGDARSTAERICHSDEFERDAASVHALLYCVSGALTDDACERASAMRTYRRLKADTARFIAQLKPYAHALERSLSYRIGDVSGIGMGQHADVCLFDPPYFGRSSFKQFCSPLLALLGRRMPDDEALLADETLYQHALSGWLTSCFDALNDDGAIVFTTSPGALEQRRQLRAAAARLGLNLEQADYDGMPYLYAAKRDTRSQPRIGNHR
jgi:hypothetical protein